MRAGSEDNRLLESGGPGGRRRRRTDHRGRRGSGQHSGLGGHRDLHWDTAGTRPGIAVSSTSTTGGPDPSSSHKIVGVCSASARVLLSTETDTH